MMDEDRKPMDVGKISSIESKVIDIPLISRDDATWTQFMGAENVAEMALRGEQRKHTESRMPEVL